ncbi:hypothetical protein [Denitratimonas sp. CY0512]|uniref:hypothetical protein n=1 Tax=Denitratimonas sp. CY0512 TaxID=3131940 RepID=UPI0030B4A03C
MHWYALSKTSGIATLCASESDARKAAQEYDETWPMAAPHVATRLQPIDAYDGIDVAEELRNVLRWEEKRMGAVSAGVLKEVIERLGKMLVPANYNSMINRCVIRQPNPGFSSTFRKNLTLDQTFAGSPPPNPTT